MRFSYETKAGAQDYKLFSEVGPILLNFKVNTWTVAACCNHHGHEEKLSCAFCFFAHDSHAEGTHSTKRMVFIGIMFRCGIDLLPVCLREKKHLVWYCGGKEDMHIGRMWNSYELLAFLVHNLDLCTMCMAPWALQMTRPEWPSVARRKLCWYTCSRSEGWLRITATMLHHVLSWCKYFLKQLLL